MINYAFHTAEELSGKELKNVIEDIKCKDSQKWMLVTNEELNSFEKDNT